MPKIEVSKKSAESELDSLFTIYNHYRHPPKTSLFDTSKRPKCRSPPRGVSDAAPGLQNGAHVAEKWREWVPPGSQRAPKGPPMPPKMLPKIVQNQHPSQGVSPRVLPGCLVYPTAPQNTSIYYETLKIFALTRASEISQVSYHFPQNAAFREETNAKSTSKNRCKSHWQCKSSPERGGLGEAHLDILFGQPPLTPIYVYTYIYIYYMSSLRFNDVTYLHIL